MNKEFTYLNKNKFENKIYGIVFPDQFKIFTNYKQSRFNGGEVVRDFIAYYGDVNEFSLKLGQDGAADIVIYSGDTIDLVETPFKKNNTLKQIIDEFGFWSSYDSYQFAQMYDEVAYGVADLDFGKVGYIHMIYGSNHNYFFSFGQQKQYQKIRVEINKKLPDEKDYDNLAILLMNKYYSVENLDEVLEPDDVCFLSTDNYFSVLKKWVNNFNDISLNIDTHYNFLENILNSRKKIEMQTMVTELQNNGKASYMSNDVLNDMLFNRCMKFFSKYMADWLELCEHYMHCSENFINTIKSKGVLDNELLDVYKVLKQFIENNKQYNLGEEKIESSYANNLSKKIFTPNILDMLSTNSLKNDKDNQLKEEIFKVLSNASIPYSISDITVANEKLIELSNSKISQLLNEMIEEGKIIMKVEDKRALFEVNIDIL